MFRETLAWPSLSPDVSPNEYALWGVLGIAIIKTHVKIIGDQSASDVSARSQQMSSHSMADSSDKLYLRRHHPTHARNFTIQSHFTAQAPCFCRASTCSDVSIRPPCFMEGHISPTSEF